MIKIKKTDTIVDIISKMNGEEWNDIVLDFPLGHPILHNHLSLKILKSRTRDKKLIIVTPDRTSRLIGKHLWIEYTLIKDAAFFKEKSIHGKLLHHNFTISEYFFFEIKRYIKEIKQFFTHNKSIHNYSIKYAKQKSNIWFFLWILWISIFILFFIFYFAVTKTYVTISPELTIKSRAKNIIFQEREQSAQSYNDDLIPISKISKMISLTETFWCTWVDETKVKNGKGTVKFINKLPEEIKLLPKTRLLAENGVLFETLDWVVIPPANGSVDGEFEANIVSQIKDNEGKLVGNKANIESWLFLTLPGLKTNTDKIYAVTTTNIEGAEEYNDNKLLAPDDIENAKKILEQRLKNEALKQIKAQIKLDNETNNVTYEILWVNDIIKYNNIELQVPENLEVGKTLNTFNLSGNINIETYIYNKESVLTKLKTVVGDSIIEDSEQILSINDKSLRVASELYRQTWPFEIKASMEVEALIIHNFSNNDDNYVQKLKSMIMGLSEEEAQDILINDPKISNAKIEITPFFVNKISNIPENIIFQVKEEL